jgi:hypothetical protein
MAEEVRRVPLPQSQIKATLEKGASGVGDEADEETWVAVGIPPQGCRFQKIDNLLEKLPPPTRRHVQEQEGGNIILRKLNKKPSFFSRLFKK